MQPFPITEENLAFLPPFVQAEVNSVTADMLEEQTGKTVLCAYHEVAGTIDHYRWNQDISKWIHFWSGGSDECCHWIYVAGAACWIKPTNDSLWFDPIDLALLPPPDQRDPRTWWCIHNSGDHHVPWHLYKITVLPESEVRTSWIDL